MEGSRRSGRVGHSVKTLEKVWILSEAVSDSKREFRWEREGSWGRGEELGKVTT